MPESRSRTTDVPGISANRSTVVRRPNHGAANAPGTTSRNAKIAITSSVCTGFASGPAWFSSAAIVSLATWFACATTAGGGVHRPGLLHDGDVRTDRDAGGHRGVEPLLLELGRARRLAVAQTAVVLAHQEHGRRLRVVTQPLLHLAEVALRGTVVPDAPLAARRDLAGEEVLQGAEVRRLVLRRGARQAGTEHVRVGLRPAVGGVRTGRVVRVGVVDDQDQGARPGRGRDDVDRRERAADRLVRVLVRRADPAMLEAVDQQEPERADHEDRRRGDGDPPADAVSGSERGPEEPDERGERQDLEDPRADLRLGERRAVHEPGDHDDPERDREPADEAPPVGMGSRPADQRERAEADEGHRRRRRVHEPVIGHDRRVGISRDLVGRAEDHRRRARRSGRSHQRGRDVEPIGRHPARSGEPDGRPDRDRDERHHDHRLHRADPLQQPVDEERLRVRRRERRILQARGRAPDPDHPARQPDDHARARPTGASGRRSGAPSRAGTGT